MACFLRGPGRAAAACCACWEAALRQTPQEALKAFRRLALFPSRQQARDRDPSRGPYGRDSEPPAAALNSSLPHQASLVAQIVKRLHAMRETEARLETKAPEGGNDKPLCSRLKILRDRAAWWATVQEAAKSRRRLSDFIFFLLELRRPAQGLRLRRLP
ncbi:unnamed protein product [Rangifer tarandus platyrhynchus]|uniref:Uncharacterized protein n=2 Tax=Rangifer tarandus platyrhynchus TaxID=3082113 RepID=A0AC60A283_RANTA|nr:unnamed protein product [Rangifer tarandus platyrhynchus]